MRTTITCYIAIAMNFVHYANGHGLLSVPKPTFKDGINDITNFCGTVNGNKALPGEKYDDNPQANVQGFTRQFLKSKFKSIKELIAANGDGCGECGLTKADGDIQQLPSDGKIKWSHGSEGFVLSHEGPCELWCDNTRVFHNENCARNVPDGTLPIDVNQCRGANRLTMIWMAMHQAEWQIYKNCVRLSANSNPAPAPGPAPGPDKGYSAPAPAPDKGYPAPAPGPDKGYPAPAPGPDKGYPAPAPGPDKGSSTPGCSSPSMKSDSLATWDQCGGKGFSGTGQCKAPDVCTPRNDCFSQCMAGKP